MYVFGVFGFGCLEGSKTASLRLIFRFLRKRKFFPVILWMYEIENPAETRCILLKLQGCGDIFFVGYDNNIYKQCPKSISLKSQKPHFLDK